MLSFAQRMHLAAAIAASSLLSACGQKEVAACNSSAVHDVIIKNNTEKFKKAQERRELADAIAGKRPAGAQSLIVTAGNLAGKITNIRQTSFDKTNNTRFCAADFEYDQNIFEDYEIVSTWIDRTVCEGSLTYKIEKVIDKPNDFYVSWRCVR